MEVTKRNEFPKVQVMNKLGDTVNFTHSYAEAITPSDSASMKLDGRTPSALYLDTDSILNLVFEGHPDDFSGIVMNLKAGYHPLAIKKVLATGTILGGQLIALL